MYPYREQSSYSTVDFIKRAIKYFGYRPDIIQTDNGAEFTHFKKTDRIHPMDVLCNELGITHRLIRPRTPRHNGKVERSHRNDQERFYNYLRFYCYHDLVSQMKRYLNRSNNIPIKYRAGNPLWKDVSNWKRTKFLFRLSDIRQSSEIRMIIMLHIDFLYLPFTS